MTEILSIWSSDSKKSLNLGLLGIGSALKATSTVGEGAIEVVEEGVSSEEVDSLLSGDGSLEGTVSVEGTTSLVLLSLLGQLHSEGFPQEVNKPPTIVTMKEADRIRFFFIMKSP